MDRAYFVWLGVLATGGLLGLFLKPRVVGIFVGGVLGLLLAGFLIGAATGYESAIWIAGIALMAAPVLGAILFFGAVVSNAAVTALKRRRQSRRGNEG
jgi:hypothetical protein